MLLYAQFLCWISPTILLVLVCSFCLHIAKVSTGWDKDAFRLLIRDYGRIFVAAILLTVFVSGFSAALFAISFPLNLFDEQLKGVALAVVSECSLFGALVYFYVQGLSHRLSEIRKQGVGVFEGEIRTLDFNGKNVVLVGFGRDQFQMRWNAWRQHAPRVNDRVKVIWVGNRNERDAVQFIIPMRKTKGIVPEVRQAATT